MRVYAIAAAVLLAIDPASLDHQGRKIRGFLRSFGDWINSSKGERAGRHGPRLPHRPPGPAARV